MIRAIVLLWTIALSVVAFAHPANVATSLIKVGEDRRLSMSLRFDIAAFATEARPKDANDEAMNALLDGPDGNLSAVLKAAESRFRREFSISGIPNLEKISFPGVAEVRAYLATDPHPRLPLMLSVEIEGQIQEIQSTIAVRYPALLDTVIQTVEFPYLEPISEPVEGGKVSSSLPVPTAAQIAKAKTDLSAPRTVAVPDVTPAKAPTATSSPSPTPSKPPVVAKKMQPPAGKEAVSTESKPPVQPAAPIIKPTITTPVETTAIQPSVTEVATTPRSAWSNIETYLKMGFTHILPEGIDHILFVLGLFLLGSSTKALIKQITAFTVAHSITLALATLNIVQLPGRIIEPLIAASIAFVAIENLFVKDVKAWRPVIVFVFGLVHGMGFAEVFADAGLRGKGLVTALLSFNVGVEAGQLAVVAMALGAVGWFRADPRYRRVVVMPTSALIGLLALFWTFQRIIQA